LVIPRYSGRNPSLLGLVVVVGPVDCVDNVRFCRSDDWSPVEEPWTEMVNNVALLWINAGCPQGRYPKHGVINSMEAVHTQVVLPLPTAITEAAVHRVIPRLWMTSMSSR